MGRTFWMLIIAELAAIALLLVLCLFGQVTSPLIIPLVGALVLVWLTAAVFAPLSILLGGLMLAATTGALGQLQLGEIPFSVNGILVAALGLASFVATVVHYRSQFQTREDLKAWLLDGVPFLALFAWAVFRTLFAPRLPDALSDVLIWAAVAAFYTLARAYWLARPEDIWRGTAALNWIALLPFSVILVELFLGRIEYQNSSLDSAVGIYTLLGVRMPAAFFAFLLIPVLAHLRRLPRPYSRDFWILALLALLMGVWIYVSLSRTSFVLMAGVIIPLSLIQPRNLIKAGIVVVACTLLIAAFVLSPFYLRISPEAAELETTTSALVGEDEAAQSREDELASVLTMGRAEAWTYLVEEVLGRSPLIGFGTGASREDVKVANPSLEHPHNEYIRLLYDLGLVGLALFVASWLFRLLVHWRSWTNTAPPAALAQRSLVAFIGTAYVLLGMVTDNFLVYFFIMGPLAIMLAMADSTRRAQTSAHASSFATLDGSELATE